MSRRPGDGVLIATDRFPVGGLEQVVVGLAGELGRSGRRVAVLADAGGGMWSRVPAGVRRVQVRPAPGVPRPVARLLALRREVRTGDVGIVHAHQRGVALLARLAVLGTRVAVVEHVHNVFRPSPVARLLSFRGHVLVACTSAVARMLVEEFGRPAARVRLVENGVADPGATPRTGGVVLRLVGAGRLHEQKDPLRFVRVVAALAARRPAGTVRAVWLGDGPLAARVRAERDALDLGALLEIPGLVDDVATRLAEADCLLLTSQHEGLPLVALEALAVGRGAVLPDVGGCADAIDARTGLLYDPALGDDALAALLDDRLDEAALADWAAAARSRYEDRFTFERMATEVLDVYDRAMQDRRPRSQPRLRAAQ